MSRQTPSVATLSQDTPELVLGAALSYRWSLGTLLTWVTSTGDYGLA